MTASKYLQFVEIGKSASGKTKIWDVLNMASTDPIGNIDWRAGWRRYVFCPDMSTVYDVGCLREIADFIEQQMEARV